MVSYDFLLNMFNAFLIVGISIPTIIMALKIRNRPLKVLSTLLSSFLLVHGVYHLGEALSTIPGYGSLGFASDVFFEPAGWLLYLAFVVYLWRRT